MKQKIFVVLAIALVMPVTGYATEERPQSDTRIVENSSAMTTGEVRKIDLDAQKITLRHGPIPNLDMPAMTMVFQVSDPALLRKAKTGDKVRFTAKKDGGAFIVTHIESIP